MLKHFRIAIVFISVLSFSRFCDGFEEKKSCSKDSDCAHNEQCSNQKCKDACTKHPCAENAICKVGIKNFACILVQMKPIFVYFVQFKG